MLFDKLKNVDFKYFITFVDLQLSYHLHELLFPLEAFKNFSLVKRDRDDALPFRAKDFLMLFYDISSIFGFLYSLS